ncbi:hypothetical protein [Rhodopseudomonas palustris]|uniref:Uncharacterized protein n=1 Tax=Rhodopseudomonas palustris (strain BisB18) TaxID=316056 RepID=Q215N6_RHOPB
MGRNVAFAAFAVASLWTAAAAAQAPLPFRSEVKAKLPAPPPIWTALKSSDRRAEFIRLCTTHMAGRWAHPQAVCGCLHDHAVASVQDPDLREALLRGIGETGVPSIENEWVPAAKQSRIDETFTQIAKPALQCMFEPLP